MRTGVARVPGLERTLTFSVHEHNDRHVSERIATEGIWEPLETELVRRFLATDPHGSVPRGATDGANRHLFVDCGANLGWYSLLAASWGAKVIAFEPMPVNATLLRSNVVNNGFADDVEIHQVALGAAEGSGSLKLSSDNQGDHRLVPDGVQTSSGGSIRPEVSVPIRRLDDVLQGRRPTVLKLDTQGSEVAILSGGRTALAERGLVMILEFWPYGLERCGSGADDLLELLCPLIDASHACFEIVEWRTGLAPLSMTALTELARSGGYSPEMKGFTNIVLVPVDAVDVVADLVLPPIELSAG